MALCGQSLQPELEYDSKIITLLKFREDKTMIEDYRKIKEVVMQYVNGCAAGDVELTNYHKRVKPYKKKSNKTG